MPIQHVLNDVNKQASVGSFIKDYSYKWNAPSNVIVIIIWVDFWSAVFSQVHKWNYNIVHAKLAFTRLTTADLLLLLLTSIYFYLLSLVLWNRVEMYPNYSQRCFQFQGVFRGMCFCFRVWYRSTLRARN